MKWWLSGILFLVLNSFGLVVSLLPRRLEVALGRGLGLILLKVSRRKKVAFDNIRRCFPELKNSGWRELLEKNYAHYGILVFELLHFFSPIPGHYRRYAKRNSTLTGVENFKKAQEKGKGVIFVSSHLGNWELMVSAGALGGIPITMITKHLKPEWLHLAIERARLSTGVKGAYEPRTLPAIIRALRANEAVGFVMDQYAGPPIGIPVPFFGVKVGTLAAVGTLVERTGAVVLPVATRRGPDGMVQVQIESPMDLTGFEKDSEKITGYLAAKVENWVRANPEQWLWIHRRFKNVVWPAELA